MLDPGDQVVVDGPMVGDGRMEVDESLLTGESDLVDQAPRRRPALGQLLHDRRRLYQALKVGVESFANSSPQAAATSASSHRCSAGNLIVRSVLAVVIVFEVLLVLKAVVDELTLVESVRSWTVIVALIPNGLVLSIALTYALGAVSLAGKDALVQQINAVESLSNVDVLCTDKTGTLTTGRHHRQRAQPRRTPRRGKRALGAFAASTTGTNRTGGAHRGLRRHEAPPASEALFSSERKWSGLVFDEADLPGTYVLGAPR